ncbi:hypothetical protein SAMN02745216_05040 [Desulfatibacillum alkenivorans DSM 16219]|jgi:hypothetical protein|uniref:Uncharacterized protein n=1 Tax=Desulfatibacillum alkenivorans DSM 16219 TaxID=1121393 RepID=A0A1M6ZU46_9BACT|nr:hypothetical protein [Desulfatibacillum alkenivorans]SHL34018.1 hypothetical protein SAMN02745216_05040 [Desulfatibacillum alkenivorans DSM 16219]
MAKKKGKKSKGFKDASQEVPAKKTKITPAAVIAGGLGLACIFFGATGVANGRPGGYYAMVLGLLFIGAISIGWMKKK